MKMFDFLKIGTAQSQAAPQQYNEMQPIAVKDGSRLQYPGISFLSSVIIRWQSKTDASVFRDPEPHTTQHTPRQGFTAAGKYYSSVKKLCTDDSAVTKDIYGRRVYAYRERFPCFDSYDYANENRYYRWFVLCENDRLTRIQYTDEQNTLFVTEDVCELECKLWNGMNAVGFFTEE